MTQTWFDRCYGHLLDAPDGPPSAPDPRLRSLRESIREPLRECDQGPNKGKPGPCPDPANQQKAGDTNAAASKGEAGKGEAGNADKGALSVDSAEFQKSLTTPEGVAGLRGKHAEQQKALDVEAKQAKGITDKEQRTAALAAVQAKQDELSSIDDALKAIEAGFAERGKKQTELADTLKNLGSQGLDPRDVLRKLAALAGAEDIAGSFI